MTPCLLYLFLLTIQSITIPAYMFLKGDNFRDLLFAYLEDEIIPKWDLHLTLRAPSKIAEDDTFIFFILSVEEKKA